MIALRELPPPLRLVPHEEELAPPLPGWEVLVEAYHEETSTAKTSNRSSMSLATAGYPRDVLVKAKY